MCAGNHFQSYGAISSEILQLQHYCRPLYIVQLAYAFIFLFTTLYNVLKAYSLVKYNRSVLYVLAFIILLNGQKVLSKDSTF